MRVRTLLLGGAVGAALAYFFDPASGAGRRSRARDMIAARGRKLERVAGRKARFYEGKAQGLAHVVERIGSKPLVADDRTLVDRVRSEVLGDRSVPKGALEVEAVDGIVTLRGQLDDPQLMDRIVRRVGAVPGVRSVRTLLHLPEQDAPNKAAARGASEAGEPPV